MLAMRLAVMSGEVDVDAMLRRLPARQFARWKAFYSIERFGAERDNWHAALVAQTLMSINGFTRKDGTPLQYEDFLFKFDVAMVTPPKPVQPKTDWRAQKANFKMFVDQYAAGRKK